jgi:hypothetical protein
MCIVHSTRMTSSTIVSATTTDMTVKLGITLPKSIIQKIDKRYPVLHWQHGCGILNNIASDLSTNL